MYYSGSTIKFVRVPWSVYLFSYVVGLTVFFICLASWLVSQPLSQADLYELYNIHPQLVNWYLKLAPLASLYENIPSLVYASFPIIFFIALAAFLFLIRIVFGLAYREVAEHLGEEENKFDKRKRNGLYQGDAQLHKTEITSYLLGFLGSSLLAGWGQATPLMYPEAMYYAQSLYVVMFLLSPALIVGRLVHWLPIITAGWVIARTSHPARSLIERTLARKRADRAVLRELSAVLQAQNFDDARAARLFNDLSPRKQKLWGARYKKRAKEAERLRKLVQAQTEAIQGDTSLAHDTLGLALQLRLDVPI